MTTGFRKRINAGPSRLAGFEEVPRNAWPSIPSSVMMRNRPRSLLPVGRAV